MTEKELRKKLRDLERKLDKIAETHRLRGPTAYGFERMRALGQEIDATQKALENARG